MCFRAVITLDFNLLLKYDLHGMFVLKFVPTIYDDSMMSNLISWLIHAMHNTSREKRVASKRG